MENDELTKRNNELFAELKKYSENTKEYQNIVTKIVKNNLDLVTYLAKKYFPRTPRETALNIDDLISEGYLGLLDAIKSFDLTKNVKFRTYAWECIKNQIFKGLKSEQRKHKNVFPLNNNVNDEESEFQSTKVLLSPINIEDDIAQKYETQRQIAWIRKNLDRLTPSEKKVFTAKYFSGETNLTNVTLAKKLKCSKQYISLVDNKAIDKLKEIYNAEINLTSAVETEKIVTKEALKSLILTKLSPSQKKIMLCKFYSETPKTNAQVAQEVDLSRQGVTDSLIRSCKKLCNLCDSVKDTKHLKNILKIRNEEIEKTR